MRLYLNIRQNSIRHSKIKSQYIHGISCNALYYLAQCSWLHGKIKICGDWDDLIMSGLVTSKKINDLMKQPKRWSHYSFSGVIIDN